MLRLISFVDSSDGYTEYQRDTIEYIKTNFPGVKVGGGNVVDRVVLTLLNQDGRKVGIGGGPYTLPESSKGLGAVRQVPIEVAKAGMNTVKNRGVYSHLFRRRNCDYHIVLAPARCRLRHDGGAISLGSMKPEQKVKRGNS